MPKAPILILFANLKSNLGDLAILHAMLVDLARHYPGHPVRVASHGQHEVDQARVDGMMERLPSRFEYVGKLPFRRMPRILSLFKRLGFSRKVGDALVTRWTAEFASHPVIKSAGECAAVFFAGGEQWSGFSHSATMFAVLEAVAQHNKEIRMHPFSVKKRLLENHGHARLVAYFAKFRGGMVLRDGHSAAILRQVRGDAVSGADCVFMLSETASELTRQSPVCASGPITLAVTCGRGAGADDLKSAILSLQQAGHTVRLMTSCEKEDAADLQRLADETGASYLAPLTWQDTVMEFRQSSLVVTNRLHCMIFTLFAEAPLLPLLNREKVVGVRKDAGLTHAIRDLGELDAGMVAQCLLDRSLILSEMAAYRASSARNRLSPMTS